MKKFNRYTETGLGLANNGRLLYPNEYKFQHMSVVKIGDIIFNGMNAYQPPYISLEQVFVVVSLPSKDTEWEYGERYGERYCFDVECVKTKDVIQMYTTDFNIHIANGWNKLAGKYEYIGYNILTPEQLEEIKQNKKYDKFTKELKSLPEKSLKEIRPFGYVVWEHTSNHYNHTYIYHMCEYGVFLYDYMVELKTSKISKSPWKKVANHKVAYVRNDNNKYFHSFAALNEHFPHIPEHIVGVRK